MKKTLFIATLLFSSLIHADNIDILLQDKDNISSLYITEADDIDSLNSVTYFISKKEIERIIIDTFRVFSDEIGYTNGAVIVPMSEATKNKLEDEQIIQDNTFLIKSKSKCNFSFSQKDFLIFEDRTTNECFYFITEDDMNWLIEILGTIYQNTDNLKHTKDLPSIQKKSIENLLLNGVNIDTSIVNNENKNLILRFVDYLSGKIKDELS